MKKTLLIVVSLLVVAAIYWQFSREEQIAVRLTNVEQGRVEATVANTRAGTIKACQRSRLSMPIGGQVANLLVDEGDLVAEGQVLIQLWNDDQQARVVEAKTRVTAAGEFAKESCHRAANDARELKRKQGLAAKKLISEETLDAAQTLASVSSFSCAKARAGVETAEANVALQAALYEKTRLRAPFAGVVAEINGEVGEYITPSPPGVATPPAIDLIARNCLYVSAPIDEVDAAAIELQMPARISLDAFRGQVFRGHVTRIAPYVKEFEKQARTVDIEVAFDALPDDLTLLIGYSADIEIILSQRDNALRIPTETVIDGNRVLLYDAATGLLSYRQFKPGLSNWTSTEVVEGLSEGEAILLSLDTEGAVDGARVAPISPTIR
ncbi:MAG: efflux RND transporter periplasmic adaptor subunit [Gammaproteobacteria bacterium]|nr:efflux RND transporter periplasmic adaptor subunit [Gammaproteobacteria bacterium]MBQ0841072.1 efflux RND transporter periplasmic adaptor subunit [Gammaproteobacteria bacterium]